MNQQVLDLVLASPRLPSLPAVALEVIDLVRQPEVNLRQVTHVLSHDPALAAKILKTVNSSFYGRTQPMSTITQALVVLGLESVRTLALGFSLVPNLRKACEDGFDHLQFWKRSLFTAVATRTLARRLGLVQTEEAFLGGLMQDLGVLAMGQVLGANYGRLVTDAGEDHRLLRRLEREYLQIDHTQVGAAMAKAWHLPPVLWACIACHEEPDLASEDLLPLVRCVALGNRVADVFITARPAGPLEQYMTLAETWFGLSRSETEPLLATIHHDSDEMRRLLDLPTGPLGDAQEILARANEALMQINLQQAQASIALQAQNRALEERASSDPLTGAANRGCLNQFVTAHFDQTRATGTPLSVLFFDADHFKKVNDTHGHQAGDCVLVELAGLLRKLAPAGALVARYGGEEFAVVAPGMERAAAAQFAEHCRRSVAAMQVDIGGGRTLPVTVSIGVASTQGAAFERAEQLIKAADQGVYAAKAAGRNCVRVFAPRRPAPAAAAG